MGRSFSFFWNFCRYLLDNSFSFSGGFFLFNDVFCVMLFVDDAEGGGLDPLYLVFSLFFHAEHSGKGGKRVRI